MLKQFSIVGLIVALCAALVYSKTEKQHSCPCGETCKCVVCNCHEDK